jgi:hypothetical protein
MYSVPSMDHGVNCNLSWDIGQCTVSVQCTIYGGANCNKSWDIGKCTVYPPWTMWQIVTKVGILDNVLVQ